MVRGFLFTLEVVFPSVFLDESSSNSSVRKERIIVTICIKIQVVGDWIKLLHNKITVLAANFLIRTFSIVLKSILDQIDCLIYAFSF